MSSLPTDIILLPKWPYGGGGGGGEESPLVSSVCSWSAGILNHSPATAELRRRKCFLIPTVIGHDDYCKIMYWFYEPTALMCTLKIFMVYLDFVLKYSNYCICIIIKHDILFGTRNCHNCVELAICNNEFWL
jgi:hypothetical protein